MNKKRRENGDGMGGEVVIWDKERRKGRVGGWVGD